MNAVLVLGQEDDLTAPSARMAAEVRNDLPHTGSSYSGRGVASVLTPAWTIARAQSVQGK